LSKIDWRFGLPNWPEETEAGMAASATTLTFSLSTALRRWRAWLGQRPPRKLRLCETLALGEKRFVALVQFEQMRYLLGGTATSITLLSQVSNSPVEDSSRENSDEEAGC
jgi:flagellar biogenesis protein FliO